MSRRGAARRGAEGVEEEASSRENHFELRVAARRFHLRAVGSVGDRVRHCADVVLHAGTPRRRLIAIARRDWDNEVAPSSKLPGQNRGINVRTVASCTAVLHFVTPAPRHVRHDSARVTTVYRRTLSREIAVEMRFGVSRVFRERVMSAS